MLLNTHKTPLEVKYWAAMHKSLMALDLRDTNYVTSQEIRNGPR